MIKMEVRKIPLSIFAYARTNTAITRCAIIDRDTVVESDVVIQRNAALMALGWGLRGLPHMRRNVDGLRGTIAHVRGKGLRLAVSHLVVAAFCGYASAVVMIEPARLTAE